jgi:predicted Co/Zn/Cd cation transporter (cation efflux family)
MLDQGTAEVGEGRNAAAGVILGLLAGSMSIIFDGLSSVIDVAMDAAAVGGATGHP